MSNVSMSLVSMLYNMQLMKYAGEDGVAAYGVLMYVCMVFIAIFIGYSIGTAPVVGYHYGAENSAELKNLLKKSLIITGITSVGMLVAGEGKAAFSVVCWLRSVAFVNYPARFPDLFDFLPVLGNCDLRLRLFHSAQ